MSWLTFIDPDGTEHVLTTDVDVDVEFGVEGRFMPPVESVLERVPRQPGARRRQTQFGVREVVLPLEVFGGSEVGLRTRLRELVRAFDPTRGDGILRSTAPDGSVRQVTCRYSAGMEVVEGLDLLGNVQRAAIVLEAVDPFWYDTATSALTIGPTQAAFFPILPLRLSGSEVYADTDIVNDGDAEAWPAWTVTGPGNDPILRNLTTGEAIDLTGVSLGAGEQILIDTAPGVKTVRTGDGRNLFGDMTPASVLWALAPGRNSVRLELSGATAGTSFALSWRRRWLSA
jgi:hypothetical protein